MSLKFVLRGIFDAGHFCISASTIFICFLVASPWQESFKLTHPWIIEIRDWFEHRTIMCALRRRPGFLYKFFVVRSNFHYGRNWWPASGKHYLDIGGLTSAFRTSINFSSPRPTGWLSASVGSFPRNQMTDKLLRKIYYEITPAFVIQLGCARFLWYPFLRDNFSTRVTYWLSYLTNLTYNCT